MKRFIITTERHGPTMKGLRSAYPKSNIVQCSIAPDEFVQMAEERHCYGSDNEIEIDEPANMSEGEDGVWIQAWVFVPGIGSQYVGPSDD
jgi:hypothetical protein